MKKMIIAVLTLVAVSSAHAENVYDCKNFSLALDKSNDSYGEYIGTSERDQDLDMAAIGVLKFETADTSGKPNTVVSVDGDSFSGFVLIPNAAFETPAPAVIKVVRYPGHSEAGKTFTCKFNSQESL